MSASRWIALHCGEETQALIRNHPSAFLLLTQIAMRARWKDCPITRLTTGQAFIGDWREAGIATEAAYRHAKETLTRCELATFRGTNKGTVATLVNSMVFSIFAPTSNGQSGTQTTGRQQADSDQGTTNHPDTLKDRDTDTSHNDDSNSAPVGTAFDQQARPITWEETKNIACEIHTTGRSDPNSAIGLFPSEEIVSWATDWHVKYEATGGMLNGSKIKNPKAALESYLRSCAQNQSKRFREMHGATPADNQEPPF